MEQLLKRLRKRNPELRITMPEDLFNRLKKVQEAAGCATPKEMVKDALAVYEALVEERKTGGKAFIRKGDGTEVTIFE